MDSEIWEKIDKLSAQLAISRRRLADMINECIESPNYRGEKITKVHRTELSDYFYGRRNSKKKRIVQKVATDILVIEISRLTQEMTDNVELLNDASRLLKRVQKRCAK